MSFNFSLKSKDKNTNCNLQIGISDEQIVFSLFGVLGSKFVDVHFDSLSKAETKDLLRILTSKIEESIHGKRVISKNRTNRFSVDIFCYDPDTKALLTVYPSLTEAARDHDIPRNTLRRYIKGKKVINNLFFTLDKI